MRHIICIVLVLALRCFPGIPTLQAQHNQTRLDSLADITRSAVPDSVRLLTFGDLCYEYRFVNQDSALKYGRSGIQLGTVINHKPGLAQVLSDAAFIHYDQGEYDSAVILWKSALDLRADLKDKARMASLYLKIGGAYYRSGVYELALQNQLKALVLYEELKMPQGIGQALNNAAAVYQAQNQLDQAIVYYRKALAVHQESDHGTEIGTTLINIGNIYYLKKSFPEAKANYLAALQRLSEHSQPSNYAIGLNNLSEIYVANGRLDSARHFSRLALAVRQKIGEAGGIISSLSMLGRIETRLKNYAAAGQYLKDALSLAKEKQILPEEEKVQKNLFELYASKGEWKNALDAHVDYVQIHDSLLNESGRKEVATLQIQYETEKKEQQIRLQAASLSENEIRMQRDRVVIAGLAMTILLFSVILVLLRNRQRRKSEIANKESEIAIRETYIKASIESQENERKRFARDLHDGLGQWISSLRLSLAQIHKAETDDEKLVVLDRAEKIMKDINSEFRGIAFNLMPHTLIHSGLKAALEEMLLRLNSADGCKFTLTSFEFPERLTELAEISVYRVVQEWTNNIMKYSHADRVDIQLTGHADELIIMIEDNGNGFDIRNLSSDSGNGWKNIHSRVNLVKGSIEVDSNPSRRGTTFTLQIPNTSTIAAEAVSSQKVKAD